MMRQMLKITILTKVMNLVGRRGETDWEQARERDILAQLVGRGSVRLLLQVDGGHPSPASGQRVSQATYNTRIIAYFVLDCRNSYLEKFLEEHPFWEGGGLLLCEPDQTNFPKHPFCQASVFLFVLFFKSS